MITVNIDVTKIDKARLFKGAKGTYLDIVLFENKNGPDQFGNDGIVKQSQSKEDRDAKVETPILGNWKDRSKTKPAAASRPVALPPVATDANGMPTEPDDVPF